MVKIAYIDHSYHQNTKSTDFIPQILTAQGHCIDRFWDFSWKGGDGVSFDEVAGYDAIIIFQNMPNWNGTLYKLHPNITFIPMLDCFGYTCGRQPGGISYWARLANIKILNFSKALHYVCNAFGLESRYYQYFQPVEECAPEPRSGLHGFFWARREDQISVNTVLELIGNTKFDSLHIHQAPDPGAPPVSSLPPDVCKRLNITRSQWFAEKAEFNAVLDRANVFFAPRLEEGIGQAMLEAFSRGQCVVAPDCGTMNEYIMNGVNGLLYAPNKPEALDFSRAAELGAAGRILAMRGYQRWKDCEQKLVQFILSPCRSFYHVKTPSLFKEYIKSIPGVSGTIHKIKALMKP